MDCESCKNYEPKIKKEKFKELNTAFDNYCSSTDCDECPIGESTSNCEMWNVWVKTTA